MASLLVQPMLTFAVASARQRVDASIWHRRVGFLIVLSVVAHVVGLYLYSPDDILDALLLRSPAPFSVYGVVGLMALLATILVVLSKKRLGFAPIAWRLVHSLLGLIVVVFGGVHAIMIDGAMETHSKIALVASAIIAALYAFGGIVLRSVQARRE